ncbi:MAG TPA: molybdopterin-dependent oxidoreductase [Candidatus Nitrosotalea sp.]|nr:molybdopterin-dependent oxidoreductase [Candidatus Nitrosotalea sp.]
MTQSSRRTTALWGFGWGALAGLALVALMYLANLLLGLRPLPQLLNQPLLSLMPGFVFGFLIDTLQHAGKVVEELGLIVAMIVGLGVLGSAWALAGLRWHSAYLALGFAAFGWLVVVGVLLPGCGAGLLGLNDGPTTPLVWAALFAVYSVVLQLGGSPSSIDSVDLSRRRLLSATPIAIGALSLGLLGFKLLPDWYRAIFNPPEAALRGPSPEITPVENFYVVSKNFSDPSIAEQGWTLGVGGMVDRPMRLSLSDLRAMTATKEYVTMECISNNVGGELMSTGRFTGVALRDLVAMASPTPRGTWVAFKARDGYSESLPMSLIQGAPEILVAYELDGAPLPISHGFPARMIIPGRYGMKGPKWLDSIDVVNQESGGFWEQQGWDHNAVVKTTARIDMPVDGSLVKLGVVSLSGVAFAGTHGIGKVEYSTDGGSSWSTAPFKTPLSNLTWVLWQADWTPRREGAYKVMVRATDGSGQVQDRRNAPSYPSGASGYHSIHVDISL